MERTATGLADQKVITGALVMRIQNQHYCRHEYQINLKAELEIRQLHEKIDHRLSHKWQSMAEIQKVQLELLMDISDDNHRR
jgi:uncharacterized membrane protein